MHKRCVCASSQCFLCVSPHSYSHIHYFVVDLTPKFYNTWFSNHRFFYILKKDTEGLFWILAARPENFFFFCIIKNASFKQPSLVYFFFIIHMSDVRHTKAKDHHFSWVWLRFPPSVSASPERECYCSVCSVGIFYSEHLQYFCHLISFQKMSQ